MGELKARGLEFESYDYPNLKTIEGIADLGYARAAWFKDSEGNLLGIAQLARNLLTQSGVGRSTGRLPPFVTGSAIRLP